MPTDFSHDSPPEAPHDWNSDAARARYPLNTGIRA